MSRSKFRQEDSSTNGHINQKLCVFFTENQMYECARILGLVSLNVPWECAAVHVSRRPDCRSVFVSGFHLSVTVAKDWEFLPNSERNRYQTAKSSS